MSNHTNSRHEANANVAKTTRIAGWLFVVLGTGSIIWLSLSNSPRLGSPLLPADKAAGIILYLIPGISLLMLSGGAQFGRRAALLACLALGTAMAALFAAGLALEAIRITRNSRAVRVEHLTLAHPAILCALMIILAVQASLALRARRHATTSGFAPIMTRPTAASSEPPDNGPGTSS